MNIKDGLAGKILRVDLTHGKVTTESLESNTFHQFLMGTGYATKILWDELEAGIAPLGEKNKLLLSTGILTATGCPGSDSLFSCFKSPLTGCWGEARCGGGMGVELKKAGFDIVIVEGASEKPVYLLIRDNEAQMRTADHLWGKLVPETQETLKAELDDQKSRVICIGPAGEKRVRFANMMVEDLRAMGRCGGGAVMGSKNLKAIVLHGTQKVPVADSASMKSLIKEMTQLEAQHPESDYRFRRMKILRPHFAWEQHLFFRTMTPAAKLPPRMRSQTPGVREKRCTRTLKSMLPVMKAV